MTTLIDETLPLNTDLAGQGAARIRETRAALNQLDTSFKNFSENLYVVGLERRELDDFVDISPTFPWFCLSKPTVVQTTANYTQEYIDVRRARKWTRERAGASPVSSFGGAWVTNVFTLTNNATNNAFLAELLEDWEFHGKPTTGWRVLFDGTTELDITNIVLSTRKITTAANGSGTSIEIYTNRVKGSTTSCKHFSEAGLADYQAGGGKIAGAFRRDKMQRITAYLEAASNNASKLGLFGTVSPTVSGAFSLDGATQSINQFGGAAAAAGQRGLNFNSAGSPDARTSTETTGETHAKSATVFKYLFCGSYTV
jgi:hypothetical protein